MKPLRQSHCLYFLCLFLLVDCSDGGSSGPSGTQPDADATDTQAETVDDLIEADSAADAIDEPDAASDVVAEDPEMGDSAADPDLDLMTEPDVGFTWPDSPGGYVVGPISYVRSLTIAEEDCCRDFGSMSAGEGVDNAIGSLANLSGEVAQGSLNQAVEAGDPVVLLDHQRFDGETDPEFILVALLATYEGATTHTEAALGLGTFDVDPFGFLPASGEPAFKLETASTQAQAMTASVGTLRLPMAVGPTVLPLNVYDAEVSGVATVNEDGVAYTSGVITGYIAVQEYYDAVNQAVEDCECLTLTGPLMAWNGFVWEEHCDQMVVTCNESDPTICGQLGDSTNCSFQAAIGLFGADLDTNDDGTDDALSLGVRFEGVAGEVVGLIE